MRGIDLASRLLDSVGSTEASASLLARAGVVRPTRANAGNESPDRDKESNWLPAPVATFCPNRSHTALLFLLTSSSFYPWQDDAKKDREPNRCLPVYSACSMNDEVRKQSHNDGNNQCESEHSYSLNEYSPDDHSQPP